VLRQRIRARQSPLRFIGRLLLILLCLILIWYGAMLVLLALKVAPETVNDISGYRSVYDHLASIATGDITDESRIITAVAGLFSFLLFGYLALKELPRPYLARSGVRLADDEQGTLEVQPRAIERVAEAAASENPAVSSANGRYGGDDLTVNLSVLRARDAADTLRDVQQRVTAALQQHELPAVPVSVILTGFDRQQRRELS